MKAVREKCYPECVKSGRFDQSHRFRARPIKKPVASYGEWGYQNLDRIGDTLIEGYVIILDQTAPTTVLEGWALDPLAQTTASGVTIQVGERYYETVYGKERDTVAEFFHNDAYLNCGYTIELDTQELIAAQSIAIYVISADGAYQYPPETYTIRLSTIKPVVSYTEWGFHNLDRLGDIHAEGYTVNVDQTKETTVVEGWALDPLANSTASGVTIQIGDQYYEAEYGKERDTVAEYFQNDSYLKCGYLLEVNTQELLVAGSMKVHVISSDGAYQYPPEEYVIQGK